MVIRWGLEFREAVEVPAEFGVGVSSASAVDTRVLSTRDKEFQELTDFSVEGLSRDPLGLPANFERKLRRLV
jgi:hypothetical protein